MIAQFFDFLRAEPDAAIVVFALVLAALSAAAAVILDVLYPDAAKRRRRF